MERIILGIPILSHFWQLLNTGGIFTQAVTALVLWLIIPLGGWVVLFWLAYKLRRKWQGSLVFKKVFRGLDLDCRASK